MKRSPAVLAALLFALPLGACTKSSSSSAKSSKSTELATDNGSSSKPSQHVLARIGEETVTEAEAIAEFRTLATIANAAAASASQSSATKYNVNKPSREALIQTLSQLAFREALKLSLKTRNGKVTAADRVDAEKRLKEQLAQSAGVKLPADYRKKTINEYAIETAVIRTFHLDDASLKAEYKKNPPEAVPCAHHILVKTEQEAADALAKLKSGTKFEDLARLISTDTGSGTSGGDLGCTDPSSYVAEFGDALKALKPGETSGAVKSEYGFHIIRRDKDEVPSFDETAAKWKQERFPKAQETVEKTIRYTKGYDPSAPSSTTTTSSKKSSK